MVANWLATFGITGNPITAWSDGSNSLAASGAARPAVGTDFKTGASLVFDGTSDVMHLTPNPMTSANGSLGLVFKTGASADGAIIASIADDVLSGAIFYADAGDFILNLDTATLTCNETHAEINTEYQVLITVNGPAVSDVRIWINDVEQTLNQIGSGPISFFNHNNLFIGATNVPDVFFTGSIGVIRSWNYALSAGERTTWSDYANDTWISDPVLSLPVLAYYPLGDAFDADLLFDRTERGNDLTPLLRQNVCTAQFRMGKSTDVANTIPQQLFGAIKGWGKWDRVLTSGEKAALAGGEYWPFSTTTSLQDAAAYYLLGEAGGSATYSDSTSGAQNLTATGTTVQVTGPNGGADKATEVNTGIYLTKATPGPTLQSGGKTITIAGWVKLNSKPAGNIKQQIMWGQIDHDNGVYGFTSYYDPTADRFCADFDAGDGAELLQGTALVEASVSPSVGVWYFFLQEYDESTNTYSLSINNGTPTTVTPVLQPTPIAGVLDDGSRFYANPTLDFAARRSGWDTGTTGNSCARIAAAPDRTFGSTPKTVWGWIKANDTTTLQHVFGISNGTTCDWAILIEGDELSFAFGDPASKVSVPFTDNNWHMFVAWYDGSDINVRLDDGATVSDAADTPAPQIYKTTMGSSNIASLQFDGILNGVGIADGEPSSDDLAALWNDGDGYDYEPSSEQPPATAAGLIMWTRANAFTLANSTPVSSAPDRSGNGYAWLQTDPTLMPLYKTNIINGLPVYRGDGSDDVMVTRVLGANIQMVIAVLRVNTFSVISGLGSLGGTALGGGKRILTFYPSANVLYVGDGNEFFGTAFLPYVNGVQTSVVSGSGFHVIAIVGTAPTAPGVFKPFFLNPNSKFVDIDIAEVLFYETDAALAAETSRLMTKYNLP